MHSRSLAHIILMFTTLSVALDSGRDRIEKILVAKRLGEKIDSAGFHGPHRHGDIAMSRNKHDWNSNIRLRQLGLEVETAQPRQSDVEHQTTGNIWTPALEELRSRFECLDPQPYGMEEPGERLAHRRVVVHYEDDRLVRAPIGI